MTAVGLYVHIPFCHARCGYCDFATVVGQENRIPTYIDALKSESLQYKGARLKTLFVGGGTPTVLKPNQIVDLFGTLKGVFDFSTLEEATVEANPESATDEVLMAYKSAGFNRLSFGLQTTQNTLLEKMERLHSWEGFLNRYERARSLGFSNINVDLIFGLPDQSMEDWHHTLQDVLRIKPDHISLYALKIEPGTKFDADGVTINDDEQAEMYLKASTMLQSEGFRHYEISNFSTEKKESRHNLLYWKNADTIGIGVSAASYVNGIRKTNTRSLNDYLDAYQKESAPPKNETALDPETREKEDIMLGLRLNQGVDWSTIRHLNEPLFQTFLDQGLASVSNGRYALNPQGWLVSNQLFQHLV